MDIRIISFNIHKGIGWDIRKSTFSQIQHYLQEQNVDIIFLQEIRGTQFDDLTAWPYSCYGKNAIHSKGHHGNAILSKFPIEFVANLDISMHRYESRGLLHATLTLSQQNALHLLCLHLGLFRNDRKKQLKKIIDYIHLNIPGNAPLILGGDFNDWNNFATIPLIHHMGLREAFLGSFGRYARTYPAWAPVFRLDRIYTRGFHIHQAHRLTKKPWRFLSDHIAIEAHLEPEFPFNNVYQESILINEDYFTSLLRDIESAKKTIDLETYIYVDDEFGQKVSDALCAAAKRGVQVRILVDGVGTTEWGNHLTTQMENAGVLTRVFHPLPWIIKHWYRSSKVEDNFFQKIIYFFSRINIRNHRKICIIDSSVIYIGSANIIQQYVTLDNTIFKFRDTTVKITHVKTDEVQYAFDKAWGKIPILKRMRGFFKPIEFDPIFRLNYSWRQRSMLYRSLLKRIRHCKKRIWVTNAYFVPSIFLLRQLTKAAKQGVDVKILLPGKYDTPVLSFVTKTFYSFLVNAGVKIYEYSPAILHAKSFIIDDWFCVGSSNLNHRSLKHDLEADVNIRTSEAKIFLEKQFLLDLQNSREINEDEIKNTSIFGKILGKFLLIIRYWL